MKKIVSVGLLILFTFNLGGYYFLFWALQSRADQQLSRQLDENINNVGNSFEIKIPLNLPYPLQQTDFQRKDGEFVYKSEHFRLVKQKLANDTLTIVCVKNQKAQQLINLMDEFSKTSSDQTDGVMLSGKVLQEYEPFEFFQMMTASGWTQNQGDYPSTSDLHSITLASPSPPPRS
ncbi:MAG TPA: hypothetical protein VL728_20135 [Cyclobacteriaceae bacterium]|nr:hypothetical protein [Cyclobacteriaceae bacterium]